MENKNSIIYWTCNTHSWKRLIAMLLKFCLWSFSVSQRWGRTSQTWQWLMVTRIRREGKRGRGRSKCTATRVGTLSTHPPRFATPHVSRVTRHAHHEISFNRIYLEAEARARGREDKHSGTGRWIPLLLAGEMENGDEPSVAKGGGRLRRLVVHSFGEPPVLASAVLGHTRACVRVCVWRGSTSLGERQTHNCCFARRSRISQTFSCLHLWTFRASIEKLSLGFVRFPWLNACYWRHNCNFYPSGDKSNRTDPLARSNYFV